MIDPAIVRACPAYSCTACGRDMIVLVGDAPSHPRCHRCRMLPGWHAKPEVVALCKADEQLLAVAADPAGAETGRALQ